MMVLHLLLALWMGLFATTAWAVDLDQLLQQVKRQQQRLDQQNRQREQRFLAEKQQRQRLLAQARTQLAALEQEVAALKAEFEANRKTLAQLEERLQASSGVLGEITGTVRQVAGDLKADLQQSLVSAQFHGRTEKLAAITDSRRLPTLEQLQTLWFLLLQEMTESGKVVRFKTEVLDPAGKPHRTEVVRIGVFNAIADAGYLRYLPETEQLMVLPRQPGGRPLKLARAFLTARGDWAALAVDPTRGVLLDLLLHAPDPWERIQQGGIIGYLILALGAIGLVIVVVRLTDLLRVGARVESQLADLESPRDDNPLGRIFLATMESRETDPENLQALLDEAVLREIPPLERGQALVKLLTAVAPLLGLLGTVTGMIQTFQAISLFGTGDPKLMAGGISQALVTTMLGLAVAIPLLFLHSLLVSRSRSIIQILEEQSAGLISQILEKRHSPAR